MNSDKWFINRVAAIASVVVCFCIISVNVSAQNQSIISLTEVADRFNDDIAQYLLGRKYVLGIGTKQDFKKGAYWLERAALQGNKKALHEYGKLFIEGKGVEKNPPAALQWLLLSADQNYVEAQYEVGMYYLKGLGGAVNKSNAMDWLKRASDKGHTGASYHLGLLYKEKKIKLKTANALLAMAAQEGYDISPKSAKKSAAKSQKGKTKAAKKKSSGKKASTSKRASRAGKSKFDRLLALAHKGEVDAQFSVGIALLDGKKVPVDSVEAMRWLRSAADQNHAGAQFRLGQIYRDGKGVTRSDSEAMKWFRLASGWGVVEAKQELDVLLNRQLENSRKRFLAAAKKGNPGAQYAVGSMYETGTGGARNVDAAVNWYRRAAQQNHIKAQFHLGEMYKDGMGVAPDVVEAKKWLTMAAEGGYGEANAVLQSILNNERERLLSAKNTLLKNSPIYPFHLSAEKGDSIAQYTLGMKYLEGSDVEKNPREALRWLLRAANQNYDQAQVKLGMLYYKGIDLERDLHEAAKWMEKAAQNGDAEAQYTLANMYKKGDGLARSNAKAVKWYRMAAKQGHSQARKKLGGCRFC